MEGEYRGDINNLLDQTTPPHTSQYLKVVKLLSRVGGGIKLNERRKYVQKEWSRANFALLNPHRAQSEPHLKINLDKPTKELPLSNLLTKS